MVAGVNKSISQMARPKAPEVALGRWDDWSKTNLNVSNAALTVFNATLMGLQHFWTLRFTCVLVF